MFLHKDEGAAGGGGDDNVLQIWKDILKTHIFIFGLLEKY